MSENNDHQALSEEATVLIREELKASSAGERDGEEVYILGVNWLSKWCDCSGLPLNDILKAVVSKGKEQLKHWDKEERSSGCLLQKGGSRDSLRPGAIDNSDLFDSEGDWRLRRGMVEGLDYIVLHSSSWDRLRQWHGIVSESHVVRKHCIVDTNLGSCSVDLYNVFQTDDQHSMDVEVAQPPSVSKEVLHSSGTMDSSHSHLGDVNLPQKTTPLGINIPRLSSENVISYNIPVSPGMTSDDQKFCLSPRTSSMPLSPLSVGSPLSRSFGPVPIWAEDTVMSDSSTRRGLAGLANLGNTCFMNSSLQCLCHTPSLMYAFLSGNYKTDLNTENPLGLGGKLASAFGSLLSKVWRPGASYVTPKHFKWQLAKFAPQFGGYLQQDSQELLSFLLDGLHEDLNRIKDKPYREEKDADGRPDDEVAAEAWENYRARNDSVVVDKFQGLYKSTLKCPNCNYTSVKFDPFMYLSLPLPSPKRRTFQVTTVDQFHDINPLSLAVRISKSSTVRDLVREVERIYNDHQAGTIDRSQEWVIAQWNGKSLDLFMEEDSCVDVIPEKGSVFSYFSSRSYKIYAFRYSGDCVKPSVAARTVFVHHKGGSDSANIPSVYFLPKDNYEEMQVSKSDYNNYWKVQPDQTLSAALETFASISPVKRTDDKEEGNQHARTAMDIEQSNQRKNHLYFANSNGQPKSTSYWMSSSPVIGPEDDPLPIYLYAEWEDEDQFTPIVVRDPILEHGSIYELEEQSKMPFKATLKDCLECFCQPEQLDASDTWYCRKCNDHVRGIKKLDLWYLPDVLVVHLKRFSYSRYSRDKLDTNIEFPLQELDMSGFVPRSAFPSSKKMKLSDTESFLEFTKTQEDWVYDLYAVSNHFGGMGGGHYTAFCQMPDNQRWYDFDDSHVSEIDSKSVQSASAYVLFYHRRGSDNGLAQKALEVADSITHGEDAKACDSPVKSISFGNNSILTRSSLDIVREVPSKENLHIEDAVEDDDEVMDINAI